MRDGRKGIDVTLRFNGSEIRFTSEGDISIHAKRHLIIERKLHMDNCRKEMVDEAIKNYELGPDAYDKFLNKINRAIDMEERVNKMEEVEELYGR